MGDTQGGGGETSNDSGFPVTADDEAQVAALELLKNYVETLRIIWVRFQGISQSELVSGRYSERLSRANVLLPVIADSNASFKAAIGPGAYGLYRFDKHNILRYHQRDPMRAYRRVFGYTTIDPGPSARPNPEFHGLFRHFIGEAAKYWRDKRISEVIRERATDPTFGSIAIVRRAALDLRNNLKNSSYGYINVLRVESSQALEESFKVLESPDLKAQFGADNAWDLIELVLWQYFHQSVNASTMNRMAVTGREIIRWLAEPYVLKKNRTDFEALLLRIAEYAEEWISSEEGMRLSRPTPPPRQVYVQGPPPSGASRSPVHARSVNLMPASRVVG